MERADATMLGTGKLKYALIAVVVLVGAVGAAVGLGVVGAPSVTGVDNAFGPVDDSSTVIETDLQVSNPNPIGVSLGGLTVDYAISLNDIRMAEGVKEGVDVGTGNSTLPFTTEMDNGKIPAWWVSHIRNGESTTLTVDADVHSSLLGESFGAPKVERSIDTDLISQFNSTETRPVNANAPVVSDPVLYVNETSARWGTVDNETTPIAMDFTVYNPKSTPVPITEIGYNITMNDVAVGSGTTNQTYVVPAKSEETIETKTAIDNSELDEWWVSHLERNQVTELRIDFYAKLELAGTTYTVPLDEMTYTETIETDMFGNKDGSTSAGDSGSDDGSSDSGGDSDTSTATPDSDGTATTTSSDDGSLVGDDTATPTATPSDEESTTTSTATTTTTASGNETTGDDDDGGLL
jgi:LEA14-like dessication related protein